MKIKTLYILYYIYYNIMIINETVAIILITSITGVIMKLISTCYKSKCKSVDCFGIHIIRDVIIEEEFDEQELKKLKKNDSTTI
jgi:hypothetical protein